MRATVPRLKCTPRSSIRPNTQIALFRLPFDFSVYCSLPFSTDFPSYCLCSVFSPSLLLLHLSFFVSYIMRAKQQNFLGKFERILFFSSFSSHFYIVVFPPSIFFGGPDDFLAYLLRHRSDNGPKELTRWLVNPFFFAHAWRSAFLCGRRRCYHLAQACWGTPHKGFLEEVFLPPQVCMACPSSGSHFAACTGMDRGQMNYIYWLEIHISKGLGFPFPPLAHQFLYSTRIHPMYVHVNIIRVLFGVCALNKKLGLLRASWERGTPLA